MQRLILNIANRYNKKHSLNRIKKYSRLKLNKDNAFLIAMQYDRQADTSKDKEVIKAYNQFKREVIAQYRELKKYIKFEFVENDPYKNSQEMFDDINKNKRLKVFTGGEYHKNMKNINILFRAVHDILGHYINYNSFSPSGEYRAYKHHAQMFSPLARVGLFTESIAQVCFYSINKKYAIQKSILFNNYYINLV